MKRYSVIIVPEGSQTPARFWISRKLLGVGVVVLALVLVANITFFTWSVLAAWSKKHMTQDTALLEQYIDDTKRQIDSVSKELATLGEKNKTLYSLADLPEPDRSYAIGGPQLAILDNKYELGMLSIKLDSLLHIATQERNMMDSVHRVFLERQKLLRLTPSIQPIRGLFSSGFGKRYDEMVGGWRMHEGVDICAPKGTSIRASADGKVKFADSYMGYGKMVVVDHTWYETRYAHLNEIKVKLGDSVKRGEIVGTCGRTGRATTNHLHYEVRVAGKPVNPLDYILPPTISVD